MGFEGIGARVWQPSTSHTGVQRTRHPEQLQEPPGQQGHNHTRTAIGRLEGLCCSPGALPLEADPFSRLDQLTQGSLHQSFENLQGYRLHGLSRHQYCITPENTFIPSEHPAGIPIAATCHRCPDLLPHTPEESGSICS